MSSQNRGGARVKREYVPPRLREAMSVVRLANAEHTRNATQGMRYVIVCNVHEAIDMEKPLRILDGVSGTYLSVTELFQRLSVDSQMRVYAI